MEVPMLSLDYTTESSKWPFGYGVCCCGCGESTTPIKNTDHKRDRIKGQLNRYIHGHNAKKYEFWERVDRSDDADACWPWIGPRGSRGYGISGLPGKNALAHRAAWAFTYGPIPANLLVCHNCDNPPCCNPTHLFIGTSADNNRDMMNKGRQAVGEDYKRSKLTESNVLEIRSAYANGKANQYELAAHYGVSQGTIGFVIRRETWKHI
jgi:hypothetical protein